METFPQSGRQRPDIRPEVRALTIGNYLVLYRLANSASKSFASRMAHATSQHYFDRCRQANGSLRQRYAGKR
ncbi:hypothetical protein [Mesorhizobium temperatum]|uniref:hypothetical protein n=1 Tax=Mesorhizobium temperatum TaxID=241416 RepID=UPI00315B35B7